MWGSGTPTAGPTTPQTRNVQGPVWQPDPHTGHAPQSTVSGGILQQPGTIRESSSTSFEHPTGQSSSAVSQPASPDATWLAQSLQILSPTNSPSKASQASGSRAPLLSSAAPGRSVRHFKAEGGADVMALDEDEEGGQESGPPLSPLALHSEADIGRLFDLCAAHPEQTVEMAEIALQHTPRWLLDYLSSFATGKELSTLSALAPSYNVAESAAYRTSFGDGAAVPLELHRVLMFSKVTLADEDDYIPVVNGAQGGRAGQGMRQGRSTLGGVHNGGVTYV